MTNEIQTMLANFHNDESGATATEYIILLVLIACFVISVVKLFGSTVSSKFSEANASMKAQVTF